jgi:hypothetical protein
MARKIKGAVVPYTGADGCVYRALRFTAYIADLEQVYREGGV